MILKMNPFFGGCASNKEKCIKDIVYIQAIN